MDDRALRPGGNDNQGGYIWLRYSTQFTTGGRTHTIEMGVPMPLGASPETREQLLREAEAGMSQLSTHVEQRVSQVMQRAQPSQSASPSPRPTPAPKPPTRSASVPAPQTAAQPAQPLPTPITARETGAVHEEQMVSTRQNIGASMPLAPISTGTTGNVPLREFLQYIKENFDLDPKQAMTLLKVKSLNDINRREALEQLQSLMLQNGKSPSPTKPTEPNRPTNTPPSRSSSDDNSPLLAPSGPTPIIVGRVRSVNDESLQEPIAAEMLREKQPIYIFDEEVGPEEEEEELDDLDELDLPRELTPQEQTQARNLLSKLRESRGPTTASPNRLQVLHNVVSSQLSTDQLHTLIEGVWNTTSLKKLKVDQVEALISWAKEDDFVGEAEAVLVLLEEEFYARGNR